MAIHTAAGRLGHRDRLQGCIPGAPATTWRRLAAIASYHRTADQPPPVDPAPETDVPARELIDPGQVEMLMRLLLSHAPWPVTTWSIHWAGSVPATTQPWKIISLLQKNVLNRRIWATRGDSIASVT